MSVEADSQRVGLDDFNHIPDLSDIEAEHAERHMGELAEPASTDPIQLETWREFANKATERIPCIVEGLWPEGSLAFIASPPKKGKTWLGLALALAVATGKPFLSRFVVTRPRPVIYVALEGHRGALMGRVGCLARGMGVDPDQEIDNFHLVYKPRGMNIADRTWAQHLIDVSASINAELVIVDVLRAAALMKENASEDFAALRSNLAPLLDDGSSLAFLHHFTKLSETSKERTPAERMSGSGAMYGALDVGIFITGSEKGARKLRLEFDGRDIAMPDSVGIELKGEGHGENGGLTYRDTAYWEKIDAPDEDDLDAPATEIVAWLLEQGGEATEYEIAAAFDVSQKTIGRRRYRLEQLGVEWYSPPGKRGVYRIRNDAYLEATLIPQVQLDVGHDPGQDTLDSVQPPSDVQPFPLEQGVCAEPRTTPDNGRVQPPESGDLQGLHTPDTLDSPTGSTRLVSEPAHPELEQTADDDIDFR